ncbi:MAG: PstS family phosphate ABC transporter substrate-binding protein [Magnetococcales bacterium]|nr:PstS family phosphate ABC transporter substrate-binding protein [Magnetococcales bacterium]
MKPTWIVTLLTTGLTLWSSDGMARTVITNKGSDTLIHLAQAWAAEYHASHPEVTIDVRGCGSNTGIAALINNSVDLANASRPMKAKERVEAERNGVKPLEHLVAHDALAILVHPGNPVTWVSLTSLSEIYGDKGFIDDWGKLGVSVPGCAGNKIQLIGRQVNSGTHDYFQEAVLGGKRDFKHNKESRDVADSAEVLDLVAKNPCAIGFVGMAYESSAVKRLKIARESGAEVVEANMENALNRRYPLSRPLYMYTNGQPQGEVKSYLDWILSDAGQCLVQQSGYAMIRPATCKQP